MNKNLYGLFFKAFSNRTRFEIIELLKRKPKNVTEICKELDFEQSRVSHNLKCLENCGFVNVKFKGKSRIYSLDKKYIVPILNKVDAHIKYYNKRLKACGVIK